MKWFLGITLSALLISTAVFGGVLYQDTQGKIAVERQRGEVLTEDLASVVAYLSSLQRPLGELTQNVANLNSQASSLDSTSSHLRENIAGIQSSLADIDQNIKALNDSLNGLKSRQGTVSDIVAKIEPSVVRIVCIGQEYLGGGSGVIVRENGYVLTNYHVVEGALLISVALSNNDAFLATVVAADADHDLAVLKLISTKTNFPAATLGSSVTVDVGDQVIAIGFPLLIYPEMAERATVTTGIISAKRTFDGYNWLQTDAAINFGNSGGPLINMNGEVIGINTLKFSVDDNFYPIESIGFAIPINDTLSLIASVAGS